MLEGFGASNRDGKLGQYGHECRACLIKSKLVPETSIWRVPKHVF